MTRSSAIRAAAPALALLLTAPPAAAQEISGVALDPAGHPIEAAPVALHRVGGGSGATVAAAATDDEGRFRFTIDAADSAVYFVAMRHEDRMYIGPMARGGVERITDYVIRADPSSEAGAVASALSGGGGGPVPPVGAAPQGFTGRRTGGAGAVWFVAILALVAAAAFLTTAPGYRRRRTRDMLVELARIENRLDAAGPATEAAADRARRDALRERLAPRA